MGCDNPPAFHSPLLPTHIPSPPLPAGDEHTVDEIYYMENLWLICIRTDRVSKYFTGRLVEYALMSEYTHILHSLYFCTNLSFQQIKS